MHFLHVRSRHARALPIIITHGWPGSVIEFFKIIDPLTNPTAHGGHAEDAFHVVAPSLPGFGFSDKPTERGWNNARIARAWAELMRRLVHSLCGTRRRLGLCRHDNTGSAAAGCSQASISICRSCFRTDPTTGLSAAEQRAVDAFRRFKPTDLAISFSSRRARKLSATPSRIRRWDRLPGSTKNFTAGPTTTAIRNRRSHATRCSTTSRSIG